MGREGVVEAPHQQQVGEGVAARRAAGGGGDGPRGGVELEARHDRRADARGEVVTDVGGEEEGRREARVDGLVADDLAAVAAHHLARGVHEQALLGVGGPTGEEGRADAGAEVEGEARGARSAGVRRLRGLGADGLADAAGARVAVQALAALVVGGAGVAEAAVAPRRGARAALRTGHARGALLGVGRAGLRRRAAGEGGRRVRAAGDDGNLHRRGLAADGRDDLGVRVDGGDVVLHRRGDHGGAGDLRAVAIGRAAHLPALEGAHAVALVIDVDVLDGEGRARLDIDGSGVLASCSGAGVWRSSPPELGRRGVLTGGC